MLTLMTFQLSSNTLCDLLILILDSNSVTDVKFYLLIYVINFSIKEQLSKKMKVVLFFVLFLHLHLMILLSSSPNKKFFLCQNKEWPPSYNYPFIMIYIILHQSQTFVNAAAYFYLTQALCVYNLFRLQFFIGSVQSQFEQMMLYTSYPVLVFI